MTNAADRNQAILPEWRLPESNHPAQPDDAAWVAALEASRRKQFAELEDL